MRAMGGHLGVGTPRLLPALGRAGWAPDAEVLGSQYAGPGNLQQCMLPGPANYDLHALDITLRLLDRRVRP